MRYTPIFLVSFFAISLGAVTPEDLKNLATPTASTPVSSDLCEEPTPQTASASLTSPKISDMLTWSEGTGLLFSFQKQDDQGRLIGKGTFTTPAQDLWHTATKEVFFYTVGQKSSQCYPPANSKDITLDELFQLYAHKIDSITDDNDQPISGKVYCDFACFSLRNLSHHLPSSAYLPHITDLYVQSANFQVLDSLNFPDLKKAEFLDGNLFGTKYMAPPSTCILSSKIFTNHPWTPLTQDDPTFTLTFSNSYIFPEAFRPHILSGRLKCVSGYGTTVSVSATNPSFLLVHQDAILSDLLGGGNHHYIPFSIDGSKELFPESSPPSFSRLLYPDTELNEKLENLDFLITNNGVWAYPASEHNASLVPSKTWRHIISFLSHPLDLMQWALAFQDMPYLQNFALEKIKHLHRPMVFNHITWPGLDNDLTKSAPSYVQPSPTHNVQQKTLIWSLPYQTLVEFVNAKVRDDSLCIMLPREIQFLNVTETITQKNEYDPEGVFVGTRWTVSWLIKQLKHEITVGSFLYDAPVNPNNSYYDVYNTSNKKHEIISVISAAAFGQFFEQAERFVSKTLKRKSSLATPKSMADDTPGPAEGDASAQECHQSDSASLSPKARALGSEDDED